MAKRAIILLLSGEEKAVDKVLADPPEPVQLARLPIARCARKRARFLPVPALPTGLLNRLLDPIDRRGSWTRPSSLRDTVATDSGALCNINQSFAFATTS